MLDFSDLVFFGYLLLGLAVLFYFGRWLIRFLSNTTITPDMRVLFTVGILAVITFAGFSQAVRLSDWRDDYKQADRELSQDETRVTPPPTSLPTSTQKDHEPQATPQDPEHEMLAFIERGYTELTQQRTELAQRITQLELFFEEAGQLGKQAPEQKYLLQAMINNRWQDYQSRTRTANNVHNAIRGFWVHYNTGSKQHALDRFKQAVPNLIDDIQTAQSRGINYRNTEAEIIRKHGNSSLKALNNKNLPNNWQTNLPKHMYVDGNYQRLSDWLQVNKYQAALTNLKLLETNYRVILDRIQKVREFRDSYRELSIPLQEALKLWQEALGHNMLAQYRILFIADSEYVLETLDITTNTTMRRQLRDALKNKTDLAVTHAERAKLRAEQSYNPAIFKGTNY